MSSFRLSKKKVHSDSRMSISAKHDETLSKIENETKNLSKYKKELTSLISTRDSNQLNKKYENLEEINKKINHLTEKIRSIETCENLTEYLYNSIEFVKNIDGIEYTENTNNNNNDGIFKYVTVDLEKRNEDNYKMYMKKCFPGESSNIEYSKNQYICSNCGNNTCQDSGAGLNI